METNVLDERLKFVADYESGQWSMTELCERYGVTRPTGYKWLARHREAGRAGLADRSRAPHQCPHRTSATTEALIVEAREQYGWGAKKPAVPSTTSLSVTTCSERTGGVIGGRIPARPPCTPTTRIRCGRPISKGSSRPPMGSTATP